jgi:AcrR family transcriptional regulator
MTLSKTDKTKQHIIEKAAPFFNKKGYADTSMSDITAATGLTKGAIYGNFENKDELALKVFDYNLSILQQGIEAAVSKKTDAIDKLLAMTDHYRQEYRHVAGRGGCPVMNAAIEADDNFPALKTKVKAAIRGWKKRIVEIMETGKKQRRIHSRIDAAKYTGVFIALIEGGIMLSKATDDPSHLSNTLERIDHIIRTELEI